MKKIIIGEKVLKKDLKIPKGYRLIKRWELLRENDTGNVEIKELLNSKYV